MTSHRQRRFQFRIIAGELKGRQLSAPDLGVTRPPLTRLRRAVFDFLAPYLTESTYLDLFSGTGSYLFEAVSRGAGSAIGVELEGRLAESINTQASALDIADRLRCLCADVFDAVPRLAQNGKRFDLIMIAPPQYLGLIDRTLVALREHPVLKAGGMIVCQHDTSESDKIAFDDWKIMQRRKYGNTTFTVIEE
ncbi:MAG: RsmD family RNA methyltransferase [Candidatus Zixiibacteriota bacterium]